MFCSDKYHGHRGENSVNQHRAAFLIILLHEHIPISTVPITQSKHCTEQVVETVTLLTYHSTNHPTPRNLPVCIHAPVFALTNQLVFLCFSLCHPLYYGSCLLDVVNYNDPFTACTEWHSLNSLLCGYLCIKQLYYWPKWISCVFDLNKLHLFIPLFNLAWTSIMF